MLSPQNTKKDIDTLEAALLSVPFENKTQQKRQTFKYTYSTERIRNIREAVFAPHETLHVSETLGRICASPTVSCPPAVPIAITGEVITENTLRMLEYYEIKEIDVVIEQI